MDMGLKDRVALVAASSKGLGKAVAVGLAREGARVVMCSRDAGAIERAAEEVRAAGSGEVLARAADVTDAAQVRALVEAARERFGGIDICVANSGGPPFRTFDQTSLEDWRGAVDLNLMSTLHLAREVLPGMKAQGWGRLIAITSVSVKQPLEGLILSNSIRAGVTGLIKSLANEYGPYGVLCNCVCPGFTLTARLEQLLEKAAAEEGVERSEIERRRAAQTPLRRIGLPEEFANVVVFLASERASYVTGTSIAVDGGLVRGLL
jgi:3-oxoacyl-[acyl-carrier protein] reductase